MYGANGIAGFTYKKNGVTSNYYYRKNLLGDIVAVYGENGTKYAEYAYDAWGNCTILVNSNGIATLNPYRYRGYYYDSEFGLYYLNARYYDPEVGRFISQDSIAYLDPETLNGLNLFAYCLNNPIMAIDPDGTDAIYAVIYESNRGVPIVGHSVLYFEDENGVWWKTEYTGSTKANAKVYLEKMGDYSKVEEDINSHKAQNSLQSFLSFFKFYGISTIRYSGDYSDCYDKALYYRDNGYGKYNLITNNCLHYVKDVLKEGESDNFLMELYQNYSIHIIPSIFMLGSKIINFLSVVFRSVKIGGNMLL